MALVVMTNAILFILKMYESTKVRMYASTMCYFIE